MIAMAIEALVSLLVLSGSLLMLLSAIGILRFPDVYSRVHAMGLASSLGIFLIILGSAIVFFPVSIGVSLKGLLTVAFILITFPMIAHAISWTAYKTGVPMAGDKIIDELEESRSDASRD